MQPPPRTAPSGAVGPPPPSSGTNAFRRNRPHKHGGAAAMTSAIPPTQPMTDPFAFGPAQSSNPPSTEPGYFYSQEPMPYIAQLPNPAPHLHFNHHILLPLPQHPQFKHQLNFSPSPRLFIPTGYPITVAAHLQFKTTFSLPVICHLSLSILMPHPCPLSTLTPTFFPIPKSRSASSHKYDGANGQQNSHYPAQSYFSQSAAPLEPWFNQNPPQHASPVPTLKPPVIPEPFRCSFEGTM
ncbi:hypothetical protein E1301_Tti022236 [Triplophysa tibetana]|uniref:Uncharacterized protein n=1 Tax=Triplophysa tibetana TaxID=1572043 RepID=A0A5A9PEW8_9TELE|nr:hypothetical protein E1301_Tti022236 [Triplophysa tibetana]